MIVILGKHRRDENRMVTEAEEYLPVSPGGILIVRFVAKTKGQLCIEANLKPSAGASGAHQVLTWPQLSRSSASDSAHVFRTTRLLRHVTRNFPAASHVIVGDSHQASTYFAKQLRWEQGTRIVLSPEGLGVFRSKYGGYSWRVTGKISAARSLIPSLIKSCGRLRFLTLTPTEFEETNFWWLAGHLGQLLFARSPKNLNHMVLNHVDLVVSEWDSNVDLGITSSSWLRTGSKRSPDCSKSGGGHTTRGLAYFVSQPIFLTAAEWTEVLAPLEQISIRKVILKGRSPHATDDPLLGALRRTFPNLDIASEWEGEAEERVNELLPEFLIGVTSTALFNIALRNCSIEVISLAKRLKRVAESSSSRSTRVSTYTDHQLTALEEIPGGRVTFL